MKNHSPSYLSPDAALNRQYMRLYPGDPVGSLYVGLTGWGDELVPGYLDIYPRAGWIRLDTLYYLDPSIVTWSDDGKGYGVARFPSRPDRQMLVPSGIWVRRMTRLEYAEAKQFQAERDAKRLEMAAGPLGYISPQDQTTYPKSSDYISQDAEISHQGIGRQMVGIVATVGRIIRARLGGIS